MGLKNRVRRHRAGHALLLAVIVGAMAFGAVGCGGSSSSSGGTKVTFLYPSESYDPVRAQLGLLMTKEWEKLGLSVDGKQMDFAALTQYTASRPKGFGAFISGYAARPERLDPDILLRRPFTCASVETGANFQGYCNKDYDALVQAQSEAVDYTERKKLVDEAQSKLQTDLPAVAAYHLKTLSVWNSKRFQGDKPYVSESSWVNWVFDARPLTNDRVIKIGQTWDIESTNPLVVTDGGNTDYLRLFYDTLMRVTNEGKVIPWAASKVDQRDPKTVSVTLRDGMTFHDGKPVTAEDVAFSYKLMRGAAIYKPFLDPIKSVDVDSPTQLTFHLKYAYAPLFTTTFAQIFILPKHIWEKYADAPQKFANPKPIGSGPFKWGYWRKGQELRLDAFRQHFHAPKVDGLLAVVYSNLDAVWQGLITQKVDINQSSLLVSQWNDIGKHPFLTGNESGDWGVYYLGFNVRVAPFNDPAFRKAIAYTIPYPTIVKTLFEGHATPGAGFIAPANERWHDKDLPVYPYDPKKARKILEDAGYTWKDGKLQLPAEKANG